MVIRTKHLCGVGRVTSGTDVVVDRVAYELVDHLVDGTGTDVVEGTRYVGGQLRVGYSEGAQLITAMAIGPLTLHLEDGRRMHFYITDTAGTIVNAGGGDF